MHVFGMLWVDHAFQFNISLTAFCCPIRYCLYLAPVHRFVTYLGLRWPFEYFMINDYQVCKP